ncbi:MAG TPA: hypothetical protein VLQ48_03235 [Chloroflexia bacterium]|nr:hypothetical protein [Chloroflexia bacterium]
MTAPTAKPRLSAPEAQRLRVNLLRVAGLAVVLGLVMEGVRIIGGETVALSSLIDHGLWPVMVCVAVGIGQALVGGWPARAGAFSLVATPFAFLLAKVLQKGMQVLSDGPASGDLLLEAGLRAVEYAVLAAALAWLVRQHWAGVLAHIGLGVLVGVIFGAIIAAFITPDDLGGWIAEELVFPAGCALIIFVSEVLVGVLNADTGPSVIDPT